MFVEYRAVYKLEQKSRTIDICNVCNSITENGEHRKGQNEMQIGFVDISLP